MSKNVKIKKNPKNLTENKIAEQKFKKSEEKFSNISEDLNVLDEVNVKLYKSEMVRYKSPLDLKKYKILIIGILLGVFYWIIESIIHTFIFIDKQSLIENILFPPVHEVWMRVIVNFLLIISSVYFQYLFNSKKETKQALKESEHTLRERVKELTCLYGLSKLVENPDTSIEEILQGTLDLIPPAWQFPEITCVKIRFGDNEYKMRNFKETGWKLSFFTHANSNKLIIDVSYLEDKPFLKEEEYLIDEIGKRLKVSIEQKKVIQKLRKSEEKFRSLSNNIPGMVYRARPDWSTEIITGSEAICGYSSEEFDSKEINWFDIIHSDDKEEVIHEVSKLIKNPIEIVQEYRIVAKDGSKHWVEDHKTSFFKEDGSFGGIDGVVYDIIVRKEIEQKLRESEEKFRSISSSAKDAIIQIDNNGKINYWNEAAEKIFNYKYNEVMGKDLHKLITPKKYHEDFKKGFLKFLKTGQGNVIGKPIEIEGLKKDSTKVPIELTISNVKVKDKWNAVAIIRDISERKRNQERIEDLAKFPDENTNPVLRVSREYILYINQAGLNLFKVNKGERIPFLFRGIINEVFLTNDEKKIEIEFDNHTFSFISIPVKGTDYVNIYGSNITERKKTERNLRKSEKGFRSLFENAIDGIILADIETKQLFNGNKKMCQMLGYNLGELKELNVKDIHPKKDLPYVFEQFEKQSRGEITIARNLPVKRKDGSVFYADINSSPVKVGKQKYLMGIFRDITNRKKMEEAIRRANAELENKVDERTKDLNKALEQITKSSQFKTEFLAKMSHELRTPLNPIIGFTDYLLKDISLSQKQKEYLNAIKSAAKEQLKTVKNVLDLSDMEKGEFNLNFKEFSLKSIIDQAGSIFKPLIDEKGLEFKIMGLKPGKKIIADPIRFKEILINLLSNAINYTPKGKITLVVQENRSNWRFSVEDTGIGIADEDHDIIFKEFGRVNSPDVNLVSGSGLGLYLTKRLVHLHKGKINFESKFGKGSIFQFTIPKSLQNQEPSDVKN